MEQITVKGLVTALKKLDQDLPLVYSIDDEGNAYHPIFYIPSTGHYKDNDFDNGSKDINAVCIN